MNDSGIHSRPDETEVNLFRDLVESSQDLLWQCDTEGRYTYLNNAWEKQLGYPIEEMIGRKFTDFQSKDYVDHNRKEFEKILKKGSIYHYESAYINKSGEKVVLIVSAKVIHDQQGRIIGMRGSAYNDTDHKRALKKLMKSEELFRSFFNYSPMGINIFDPNGKVIAVNNIARGYFGVSEDDPLSHYCLFDDPSVTDTTKRKIRNGEIATEERHIDFEAIEKHKMYVSSKNDNSRVFLRLTYTPLGPKSTDPIGYVIFIQDLTHLKELEEERLRVERQLYQKQKLESLGTLSGGIAHDFNNILSSIIGFTELALEDVDKGSMVEESLKEIYAGGKRARDLVKQILTFSRQSEESVKPIQLDSIANEVLHLLRATIPATIQIQQSIKKDLTIMGDATQIHQVLVNICTNAAQAMEENGGILDLRISDVPVYGGDHLDDLIPGEYAEIRISDTGVGIDSTIMDKIFDPFFTTRDIGKGTGMGLALVHGIIKSHNGTIRAQSVPGRGSVFTAYLPLIPGGGESKSDQSEILPTGDERILFIDDEYAIGKLSGKMLQNLGYEVLSLTSSLKALDLFRSKAHDFDLVITYMTMPEMTGDELAAELVKIRPDIPVILCTGYSNKISDERLEGIGIKALTYKPLSKKDLAWTVRRVLDDAGV